MCRSSCMRWYLVMAPLLVGLVGCSTTIPSSRAATASERITTSVSRGVVPFRPDRRKSWFSPDIKAAKPPLLFVSDSGTGDVYIYKVPSLKVVGTVTGFFQPQGECSDGKG